MGYTRSHRTTEKQAAAKGMEPRRIDPSDGHFNWSLLQAICGIVAGLHNCPALRLNEINGEHLPGASNRVPGILAHIDWGYGCSPVLTHAELRSGSRPGPTVGRGQSDHCSSLSPAYTSHAPSAQTTISPASIPGPAVALFGRGKSDEGDKRFTIVAPIRKPPSSTLAAR